MKERVDAPRKGGLARIVGLSLTAAAIQLPQLARLPALPRTWNAVAFDRGGKKPDRSVKYRGPIVGRSPTAPCLRIGLHFYYTMGVYGCQGG